MNSSTPWLASMAVAAASALMPAHATAADATAYMGTVSGEFGTIDLSTGVFDIRGNFGRTLAGFGVVGTGVLYATSYHTTGQLFTVDPADGSTTLVGDTGMQIDDFGSTTTGLYAIDRGANLYSISASDGSAHFIGATGLGFGSWRALSTDTDTLYFADGAALYTLSTTTGAATLVGDMGGPEVGSLTVVGGQLYGGMNNPSENVATLDTTTGKLTVGAALSGSAFPFYAMTPYDSVTPVASAVPEPRAAWLLLAGLPLLIGRRGRAAHGPRLPRP